LSYTAVDVFWEPAEELNLVPSAQLSGSV